jgi:hypothetical protein
VTARTFTFTHYARPWSINKERSGAMSRHLRAQLVAEWRGAFKMLGLTPPGPMPMMERVHIVVTPLHKGGKRMDVANCLPAAKAAIDGLVDAGMCADDTDDHVVMITFRSERRNQPRGGLEVVVKELPPRSPA